MKIVTVLGARPQFVKASVLSHAIIQSGKLAEIVVHTGQHFDKCMSDIFFAELDMDKPDYNLGIHGGTHGEMTGRMLEGIEKVLLSERPEAVLVYGDTNSTLAGALAAVKLKIPVAHIEAGLRSYNMQMPEEINRIVTDRISRWLFTPTEVAAQNLAREGFTSEKIIPVGDVMYDVALHHGARITAENRLLQRHKLIPKEYLLATIHRAENTDNPNRLANIVEVIEEIAERWPVVWPLHPRTRGLLLQAGRFQRLSKRVIILEPVGYLDMVQLEKYAAVIVTDSGGVQKEAFFYEVPCITVRDETEWTELVEAGWNKLASPENSEFLLQSIINAKGSSGRPVKPYGQGNAAQLILERLTGV